MSDGANLVLLKRTEMQGEAMIIKSFLESHDITVHIMDNTDVMNFVGHNGTRLMVAESELEKAITLINNHDFSLSD